MCPRSTRNASVSSYCPHGCLVAHWVLIALMLLLNFGKAQDTAQLQQHVCDSEMQIVMCGQIPLSEGRDWSTCCRLYRAPAELSPAAAAKQAAAVAAASIQALNNLPLREDLALNPVSVADVASATSSINWLYGDCTWELLASIPDFSQLPEKVQIKQLSVPQLDKGLIQRVKAEALSKVDQAIQQQYQKLRWVNASSGFVHPGTYAGAAELAVMQHRLANGMQPQTAAKDALLSGAGILPKIYDSGWSVPTDCPESYSGPYPVKVVDVKWSGISSALATCPGNYPSGPPAAPLDICANVSFVELDGQMTYKQAIAYIATSNELYAENVFRIVDGWAATNTDWGQIDQNGPLEAAWGCASMARSLELLRHKAPPGLINRFVDWVNQVLLPQIDHYLEETTAVAVEAHTPNLYGNWHSTVVECNMAMGLLTDDKACYDRAVALYHTTVKDYYKWGKGDHLEGRVLGECSETLRDIFHSQFGLGGLLQAAEMAWQQDEDLYSSDNHALAAAMELHARIIRAYQANDTSMLPPGFYFKESMPEPPKGCIWKFDIRQQLWTAVSTTSYQTISVLEDGRKYLVGIPFLPTGWETGYNHYVGRLGMKMPETAQLLAQNWPETYNFHWGLGTLTHAATAADLWRPGITSTTLCDLDVPPGY